LSGQALELLELALVDLEPSDALKLTHCSDLQTLGLIVPWCRVAAYNALPPGTVGQVGRAAGTRSLRGVVDEVNDGRGAELDESIMLTSRSR
jgi:hypothetical protein